MADSSTLVDRVKIFVESSGTGPFQLGNALPSFRGSEALVDGLTYSYAVESGSDYEVGQGVYVLAVDQLIRAPTLSSNGGAPVSFPANVAVNFTALAADLGPLFAEVSMYALMAAVLAFRPAGLFSAKA